jgi:predicted ATPase/signal transduction histidine kinase
MLGIVGYELKAQLYSSARTLVYRGHRESDGLPVVLKLMAEQYPSFEDVTRFKREYEVGRKVSGDGAVVVLGLEPVQSSWAIVMEDRGARTLRTVLDGRPLPWQEALRLGIKLASALASVHRRHVVHKDINPANIVIEPDGEVVRLIDFGLASLLPRENPSILSPNLLEGTLRYISPEQTGRMNRAIDYRSDLYSLGCTLYELLTGRVPFGSLEAAELVHLHIAQRPVPPHELEPDIPRPVSAIVMKLLAKMAEDRYQSALGVKSDLEDCLGRWTAGERGLELGQPGFLPGQNDIPSQFQLPQKLYGREPQVAQLMAMLEQAASGRARLALVAGDSGMGKSVLVHEIQRPLLNRRVHFLAGKFDQLQRDVPYAPLLQAFSDFVRQLLSTTGEQMKSWRQRLSAALGDNGRVLFDVLPELEQVIGPQPPVPELPPQEAQHRFHFVFQRFVMALGSEQHPLVLFLDDLQWADQSSLTLLQALLTEPRMEQLLIVGAYRESEVGPVHSLRSMLESLEREGIRFTTLTLAPLEPGHVAQLIADTFRCDPGRAGPLAKLLWERSGGNPFFVGQLLRALYEDKLIDFAVNAAEWTWDIEEIRARGLTDNVIELMTRKLQKLPEATQQVLKLAACIGNRFQLASLALVYGEASAKAAAQLYPALEEGLVLPLDARWRLAEQGGVADATYRFLHDRVQQAAYSLIPEGERAELHLRIARTLLASMAPEQLDERVIDIVHQLNLGRSLVTDQEERYEIARLNLMAGRKAKLSAAFEPASRYFSTGVALLPEGAWTSRRALCFELHMETLEAEYLNARIEQAEALSELILARTQDPFEQVKIYGTRASFAAVRRDLHRAVDEGYRALTLLGLEPPRSVDLAVLLQSLRPVQAQLAGRSTKELLSLPPMTDPRALAATRLCERLLSAIYIRNALTSFALDLEMIKLCLRHGNAPEAPYFYSIYGVIHSAVLGEMDIAAAYGELSLELLGVLDARWIKAKVYLLVGAYLQHWKKHIRETFKTLEEAVQSGLESGDMEMMAYSAALLSRHLFVSGEPLDQVIREHDKYLELTAQRRLELGAHAIRSVRQTCLCLMGHSADPKRLVGESFDEEVEVTEMKVLGYSAGLSQLYLQKVLLACVFRDAELAAAMLKAGEPYMGAQLGQVSHPIWNFMQSLALLLALERAPEAERALALAQVRANQKTLKGWAEHAPMNSLHRYLLVEAELARVQGNFLEAARLYEEATVNARKHRYLNDEALSHELAGEFYLSIGRDRLAQDSFLEAAVAYRRWGAEAKVADLERRYPQAFARSRVQSDAELRLSSTTSSKGTGTAALDLATVIKAARILSGELLLDPLLERLMQIVLESAGAQRGALVLVREERLVIEAVQEVSSPSTIRLCAPVEGSALLSTAIVHFVARTRESLVLDDASAAGLFTRDPYVVEHHLRSVLCMPLINQGRLVAILYLENNHTSGAFTEGRLEMLHLLSAQAVLALQNAFLYEQQEEYSRTLELRVEERTRELQAKNEELTRAMGQLRETQKQLVAQEKLASLGALTAGIAHELKNPLNFITNFAELSEEYAEELVSDSTSPQAQVSAEQHGRTLLQLRQSVAKIREHGLRANQIINGMLLHSREQSAARAPADLNAVLAESLHLGCHGFAAKVPGFEVDVRTDYAPGLSEVDVVLPEISRVFINAVDNACYALWRKKSASREFSPRLEVSTHEQAERVEVRIRDNGIGIAEELLGKVFHPFFTTKSAGEGAGLGLSLSHDIVVSRHQGSLRLESVEGEFTEVIIELPKRLAATCAG